MIAPLPLEKPRFHGALEGYVAFVLQNGNLTRSHYLPPQPSKDRRATPARQSRAASCYKTASSAAALGHLGAVHTRVSGAKTARGVIVKREPWDIVSRRLFD